MKDIYRKIGIDILMFFSFKVGLYAKDKGQFDISECVYKNNQKTFQ